MEITPHDFWLYLWSAFTCAILNEIRQRLREFTNARDWDQFHSPKNLVMVLSVEVGKLVEYFPWSREEQSKTFNTDRLAEVTDEIADVQLYLVGLYAI